MKKKNPIVLSNQIPIIDENDVKRGHILKNELVKYYSDIIKKECITENSRIVEYVMTTLDNTTNETKSLPIVYKIYNP